VHDSGVTGLWEVLVLPLSASVARRLVQATESDVSSSQDDGNGGLATSMVERWRRALIALLPEEVFSFLFSVVTNYKLNKRQSKAKAVFCDVFFLFLFFC
jgi:hypothetical protein